MLCKTAAAAACGFMGTLVVFYVRLASLDFADQVAYVLIALMGVRAA